MLLYGHPKLKSIYMYVFENFGAEILRTHQEHPHKKKYILRNVVRSMLLMQSITKSF